MISIKNGLKEFPNNDRYTFYLANTYHDSCQFDKAIEIYDGITKYFGKEHDDPPQLKVLEELKKEQIKLRNKENLLLVDNKK